MIVIPIVPRGFCPGVVNAVKQVNIVIEDTSYPRPIFVLGMIVHNKHVVADLTNKGVITLDDPTKTRLELLDLINHGTVIVTAHGAGKAVFQKILDKKLTLVDATCKDVYVTHDLIREYLKKDFQVIYVGKNHHPETEGVLSIDPKIKLIERVEDISSLHMNNTNIFVTNQTTFSITDIREILTQLKIKFPSLINSEEICNSTRIRQEAIIKENVDVDLCYVVGDIRSNNTLNLAKISQVTTKTKTLLIESVQDIIPQDLMHVTKVTVSSGASTPSTVTKQVINYLEKFDALNKDTWFKNN